MRNINFNDGLEEIMINNDPERVIRWNPTDAQFISRYFAFTDYVKGLYERFTAISESPGSGVSGGREDAETGESRARDAAGQIASLGTELSEALDRAFNAPVSKAAFLGANPLSPTRTGSFLFDNFLTAISPVISASAEEAGTAAKANVRRYTDAVKNPAEN